MKKLKRAIRKFVKWLTGWQRKPNLTQLREFVYLDEVSVVSLSSSLRGALAESITDSETSTLKTDSKFEVGTKGPYLKSKMGYGTEFSNSEGRQILRKSTIQSKYKDLIEDLSSRLKVLHYSENIPSPVEPSKIFKEIEEWSTGDEVAWLKSTNDFTRGDLLEFEVELSADIVYGAGLTLSSMAGVLERIGSVDQSALGDTDIDQLQVLSEILTQLLIGLIPIKSKVVGWKVMEYGKNTFLVSDLIASKLEQNKKVKILPLYVTGVIEETLFWKDVRQVLFNNYKMKILCRITEPISKEWNPIKMFDVLASIIPSMPEELLAISSGTWWQNNTMQNTEGVGTKIGNTQSSNELLAQMYIDILIEHEQISVEADDINLLIAEAKTYTGEDNFTSKVNMLKGVDSTFRERLSIDINSDKLATYRTSAIAMTASGTNINAVELIEKYADQAVEEYYLNSEVISIYW